MHCAGIDEAGYGPTLGPLCVVAVQVACAVPHDLPAILAATGVRDSKRVHRPGDLAPLEEVCLPALAWLSGKAPRSAAELFALLGEDHAQRQQAPWMAGAEDLVLPRSARALAAWRVAGIAPLGLSGRIVHPLGYNQALGSGLNKAELELALVRALLAGLRRDEQSATVVDRLGGRRYYRELVQAAWPDDLVLVEEEGPAASSYRCHHGAAEHRVAFLVDGESASPLTALASCLAKYARELHMLLFNRWFCDRQPGLRPTAGYPEDAKRWLKDLGAKDRSDFSRLMIRVERLGRDAP
jgi:ribonuclease HII